MYFDETKNQWFSTTPSDLERFGSNLSIEMVFTGRYKIPSGNVMVFCLKGTTPHLMFQTLRDEDINTLRDVSPLAYEVGSIIFMKGRTYMPTLVFRNCRFPTKSEFETYERRATV